MMSTGDVQGGLRSLEALLRGIRYPGQVDYSGLSKGDPSAFLPIVSFTLTSFSPLFTEQLMVAGLELMGKTDLRFTNALYKVLRDVFHYKPILSQQQFLQRGFSQRKLSLVCDVISLVLQRHQQLRKVQNLSTRQSTCCTAPVVSRPLAASRIEAPPASLTSSSHTEALLSSDLSVHVFSTDPLENRSTEPPAENQRPHDSSNSLQWAELEQRLSAVESRLDVLVSELSSLSLLEKRMQHIERTGGFEKVEGVVSISRASWENLMSRLVLLETQLELSSNTQAVVSLSQQPSFSSSSSSSSSSVNDASKEDLKDSLERISNMLKSTSSLLKTTDSCSVLGIQPGKIDASV